LADSQVPWGVGALAGSVSEPAWKTKPSWYLIATDDNMIPPSAQRQNGGARRLDYRGSSRQPRYIHFEAAVRGGAHCQGGEERELRNGSQLAQPKSAPPASRWGRRSSA
jgi:hypothetical protein